MADDILIEISCPNCRNPINIREHGQHVECDACGSQFILQGHVCPTCHAYHQEEQSFCRECGTALTRTCQKCQTINWAGDEYCQKCGAALDIFDLLHHQYHQTTMDRLNEQMRQADYFKEKEKEDSEKRMAELMTQEEERQRELTHSRQIQKQKDQQLLFIIGIIVLAAILIAALIVIL